MRRRFAGVMLLALLCTMDAMGKEGALMIEKPAGPARLARESEAFKNVKVLNNFCWELLNVAVAEGAREVQFSLPIARWVFVRSDADVPAGGNREVRVAVDSDRLPAIVHRKTGSLEAMRYLKAGSHALRMSMPYGGKVTHIIVRAIPVLQYADYGEDGHIAPYGPYNWEFLRKDVLPNVNEMIMARRMFPVPEEIGAWKAEGRSWIVLQTAAWQLLTADEKGIMRIKGDPEKGAEAIYQYWLGANGARHPLINGILIDEIGANNPEYDAYRKAAEKLHDTPEFKGKALNIYAYGEGLYSDERGRKLARFCIDRGGYVNSEMYLLEEPTLKAAQDRVATLAPEIANWEKAMPGVTPRLIVVLCSCSQPCENGDRYPNADFKVYMDMQMRALATNPACFALGGVEWYKSGYADEEILRWGGRLFRHYCIEGNTEPLTKDPYELSHVINADFEQGTKGWDIRAAEQGSVRADKYDSYGKLQARWGGGNDTFLWMKRSAKGANSFSQTVKNLTPGRCYSMKMYTSDYQRLQDGKSDKKQNAVSIKIDNVELLDEPSKSFQFTYPHSYGRKVDKFTPQNQYWVNYHRRIFRAKDATAKLTVSDWQSDAEPGGPVGQELMFNFIQVQPYYE